MLAAQGLAYAQTLETLSEFEVGDKWTYRFQNIGDRKEPFTYVQQAYKSEAGSGWYYTETTNPDSTRKSSVWRFDYKRADDKEGFAFDPKKPNKDGARFTNFQPFDDFFQLPLTVGKKYKIRWPNSVGHEDFDIEVEAFEKIKTEAGTFDAYRVRAAGYWNRTVPTAEGWTGSGRSGRTAWFAPAVKRVIKVEQFSRTNNGGPWNQVVSELIKWEPKAELMPALAMPAAPAPSPASAASQ